MRLGRIRINGYCKLVDAECSTPGKLIAVVGPNEAGKSSLLDALIRLRNDDAIPHLLRPRGTTIEDEDSTAIEAWFRIEDDDLVSIADVPTPDKPEWYVLHKPDGEGIQRRDCAAGRTVTGTVGEGHSTIHAGQGHSDGPTYRALRVVTM